MKRIVIALICMLLVGNIIKADTFGIGANQFTIDFVTIGQAGNAADTQVMNDGTTGYGTVGYNYRIGKYEVTNSQWNTFVSAAGTPTGNPATAYNDSAYYVDALQPTNNVSWFEAAQFCNYLTSGQKYSGAYQFDGSGNFLGINRDVSIATYGTTYVIPTENEWYKAAYYKPDGSGYSIYSSGLNTPPLADIGWNYYGGEYSSPWNVGTGSIEQNGSFDMMGNVYEWNETWIGSTRGIRGGARNSSKDDLASWDRGNVGDPSLEQGILGFRVASIPEPATVGLMLLGGLAAVRRRKMKEIR